MSRRADRLRAIYRLRTIHRTYLRRGPEEARTELWAFLEEILKSDPAWHFDIFSPFELDTHFIGLEEHDDGAFGQFYKLVRDEFIAAKGIQPHVSRNLGRQSLVTTTKTGPEKRRVVRLLAGVLLVIVIIGVGYVAGYAFGARQLEFSLVGGGVQEAGLTSATVYIDFDVHNPSNFFSYSVIEARFETYIQDPSSGKWILIGNGTLGPLSLGPRLHTRCRTYVTMNYTEAVKAVIPLLESAIEHRHINTRIDGIANVPFFTMTISLPISETRSFLL